METNNEILEKDIKHILFTIWKSKDIPTNMYQFREFIDIVYDKINKTKTNGNILIQSLLGSGRSEIVYVILSLLFKNKSTLYDKEYNLSQLPLPTEDEIIDEIINARKNKNNTTVENIEQYNFIFTYFGVESTKKIDLFATEPKKEFVSNEYSDATTEQMNPIIKLDKSGNKITEYNVMTCSFPTDETNYLQFYNMLKENNINIIIMIKNPTDKNDISINYFNNLDNLRTYDFLEEKDITLNFIHSNLQRLQKKRTRNNGNENGNEPGIRKRPATIKNTGKTGNTKKNGNRNTGTRNTGSRNTGNSTRTNTNRNRTSTLRPNTNRPRTLNRTPSNPTNTLQKLKKIEAKILIYFGCFCPPHKEHLNNIKKNINDYDKIYVFIYNDIKKNLRHGIEVDDNVKIWNIYKTLLPKEKQNKLMIIKSKPSSHPFGGGIDEMQANIKNEFPETNYTVNLLVGDDYDKNKIKDSQYMIHDYCNAQQYCTYNNTIIIMPRAIKKNNNVSSTNFIKVIKQAKETITYESIKKYIPEELLKDENISQRTELLSIINAFDKSKLK